MENKIGVVSSTYAYYNTEEALNDLAETEFKFIELVTVPGLIEHISLDPKKSSEVLNICKKYGIELFRIGAYGVLMKGENSLNNFKKILNITDSIGIDYVTTDVGEIKDKTDKKLFLKEIRMIGDYAGEKNINIGIEIHGDWCKNGKIAADLIKEINHPNVKITYDTGNTIFYGDAKPEDDIKYVIPYMGHLHLKDKRGGHKIYDFPALGEGDIDFNKIFNLIKDYHGSISIEVELDGEKHPISEINNSLKNSYDFLKNYGLV